MARGAKDSARSGLGHGAATAHLASEDKGGEDAKGQGLVAPDLPGRLVEGRASQVDAERRHMGDGEVDLGVMPLLSRPAGGGGQPQLGDTEEERDVKVQADGKDWVDGCRLG